ncbi:MAG TPA: hypothetical protein VHN99_01460 [Deinococcales bacterium]|nr:hypothetical protein [Deinococcales bacterium]
MKRSAAILLAALLLAAPSARAAGREVVYAYRPDPALDGLVARAFPGYRPDAVAAVLNDASLYYTVTGRCPGLDAPFTPDEGAWRRRTEGRGSAARLVEAQAAWTASRGNGPRVTVTWTIRDLGYPKVGVSLNVRASGPGVDAEAVEDAAFRYLNARYDWVSGGH